MKDISEFIQENAFINNFYDVVRIIEPSTKQEILFLNNKDALMSRSCYSFWQKSKKSRNGISKMALNDNKTYIEVKYDNEKMFLVTSLPINIQSEVYVMELLKDITKTGVMDSLEGKSYLEMEQNTTPEMMDLILKDELTGVYNRRFINKQLSSLLHLNKLSSKALTAMMIDVDYFKSINDEYGHLAGDQILIQLAKLLEKLALTEDGWVARYGGDEFFLLFSNVEADKASKLANNIRKKVAKNCFSYNGTEIKISVSIGVYSYDNNVSTIEEIINSADKKLYLAKQNGRDRIQV